MRSVNKTIFRRLWPNHWVTFMAVLEIFLIIFLFLTELGNVGANFWVTNIFAGAWCGLVMIVHMISLFVAGCYSPRQSTAFNAVLVTVVALVASAALISFDMAFLIQPSTCILTPTCLTNAASTVLFSYDFRQSFYSTFNSLEAFRFFTESQTKCLFQSIQLGVGCLCFLICVAYLIIYYMCLNKSKLQYAPLDQQPEPQPFYRMPPPPPPPPSRAPQPMFIPPMPPQQLMVAPIVHAPPPPVVAPAPLPPPPPPAPVMVPAPGPSLYNPEGVPAWQPPPLLAPV